MEANGVPSFKQHPSGHVVHTQHVVCTRSLGRYCTIEDPLAVSSNVVDMGPHFLAWNRKRIHGTL